MTLNIPLQIKDYFLSAFNQNNSYLIIFYEDKRGLDTIVDFHIKSSKG